MNEVIIIGDSTHNTLSVVRGLGKARIPFCLILKGDDAFCNISKSKYVRRNRLFTIDNIDECFTLLGQLSRGHIICTFDEAAEWIDSHETDLCKKFITPCRGHQIGSLFNKAEQCKLAKECGLKVPESQLFRRNQDTELTMSYPFIIKPLQSTHGEKSDIHIIHNSKELDEALASQSECSEFIVQEFIDKEYEINCLGCRTENEIIIAGAIRKHRHYPPVTGACTFGHFLPIEKLGFNKTALNKFIAKSNYHGVFSAEFLHVRNGADYFMEVNFRNDGLAQAATAAGANLHAIYADNRYKYDPSKVRSIYMMNYSIDYLHVKEGRLTVYKWWRDFFRTRCFINFSLSDPMPVVSYYSGKLRRRICR